MRPREVSGSGRRYGVLMDMNDPLAQLIRLRGALDASTPPPGTKLDQTNVGLIELYERSRATAADLCQEVGVNPEEIDARMPPFQRTPEEYGPRQMLNDIKDANTAATMLRDLTGYLGGVIEALALSQQITQQQIEAAREAARQPTGFR